MQEYRIFIPSLGRLDRQFTWDTLPEDIKAITTIVAPKDEVQGHKDRGRNVIERPVSGIANVRQWIATINKRPYLMLDDDLSFAVRKSPEAWNLRRAEPEDVGKILLELLEKLDSGEYAMVGLSPRQMNNQHFPATFKEVGKQNAVHGFNPAVLHKHNIRFNAVELMEDYHVVLSLLELGYPNYIKVDATWDQKSGAVNGVSTYRTPEKQKQAAEKLHELHPEFVKVVLKKPKQAWNDGQKERWDVTIQWKKAYKKGVENAGS